MAQVKAGVAYVDVRLGSIEQFKNKMASEIEKVGGQAAKKLGDDMNKKIAPHGKKVGNTLANSVGGSFLSRAKSTIVSGANSLVNSVGNAFSKIPGKIASAGKAVDDFGKRVGFLAFQLQGMGVLATAAFTAPIVAALTFGAVVGIKTAAQIEQATASLKALTPAGTDVEALIKRLQALAQRSPIFNTTDVIQFTQKMVASGLSVQDTEAFLQSFGNVALTVGADVGKIPFALEAMVQMMGKGKVTMEELRQQLGDALPGAMKLAADAMGMTTEKFMAAVSEGEIAPEALIKGFTKLGQSGKYLEGATKSADTLASKWQALKESLQTQLGNAFLEHADEIKKAIDDIGPSLSELIKLSAPLFGDMIKGLTGFVEKIVELVNWYKNLSPGQQDLVNKFILFMAVLGPIVLVLSGLGMAIAGISALFGALATPVGLVVLGIIALGVEIFLIVKYFKNLYDEGGKFKTFWDNLWKSTTELFAPVVDKFKEVWQAILDGWNRIKNAFAEQSTAWQDLWTLIKFVGAAIGLIVAAIFSVIWGVFKGLVGALSGIVGIITSIISGVVKIVGGILNLLIGIFTLDFGKIKSALTSIWNGLWDLIIGTIVNAVRAVKGFVEGLVTGIIEFFKWLFNVLVGHSIIPDMVNKIIEWFKRMWQKGVDLVKALGRPFLDFYNNFIQPFIDRIKSGADKAWNFIGGLKDKIVNGFRSAGSWLLDAGKNIVNGLIEGVKRMAGTLKNAILNLIPSPVRSIVANALGINSPSRVFMEYGKYTVLGYIKGLQATQPVLASSVASTFDFRPPGVSPYFGDASAPAVESRSAPKAAVLIENYHEGNNDSDKVAEDLWFKIQSRGGGI